MPIVAMQQVGPPCRVGALRQRRRRPAQQRKAPVVVGPVAPVRRLIRRTGTVVEGGVIDEIRGNRALRQTGQRDPHPLNRERRAQPGDLAQLEGIKKFREAGQHKTLIGPQRAQRRRQRRNDIAEAAGFDPRIQLGSGMQHADRGGRRRLGGIRRRDGIGLARPAFGDEIPQRRLP